MKPPTPAQRTLLDQVSGAPGEVADVLREQFAACLTRTDDDCPECFYLEPTDGASRLPNGTECPIMFGAIVAGDPEGALVLVWHEEGLVDWIEISWFGDEHPTLNSLTIHTEV